MTNLAHLDWLRDTVTPPGQARHTTYRLDREPTVGVLWTYADRDPDGSYRRIGGGRYDPASDTYGQGAFNADDVSRAAVVYLRHWRATGRATSRDAAYQLLRGLTYLQTADGPDAGNVVLWMQPDGTLNRSADPPESPDPSDSADSYWLARTLWALGEGYAAFRQADPRFAAFLRDRLNLAVHAVERQPLARYGQWLRIDGTPAPAWLIAQGADATGEALIGLAAYVEASGDPHARAVLGRLAEGVAAMRAGTARTWPFGAILPWALSRSVWHAWGGLAPAGLARASTTTGVETFRNAALADTASFTPHLLIAAGPENGWLPTPADRVQIAYGAQSRVESLLSTATAADRPGLVAVAGIAAAWFFGNNPAGTAMYDPASGRTFDGVDGAGVVNRNSGAESTIHGLLAMLALDAAPAAATIARTATVRERRTWSMVEAESGTLAGDATVYRPAEAWTGESLWSGGAGVRLGTGGSLSLTLSGAGLVLPVVELEPGAGTTRWSTGGVVRHGDVGEQGDSPAPGLLTVRTLSRSTGSGPLTVTGLDRTSIVDAVLVQPELEWLALGQPSSRHATVMVRSFAESVRRVTVAVPGGGPALVSGYDHTGRLVTRHTAGGSGVALVVAPGGFTIVRR
ncbi:hypothetical protein GCM10009558_015910 [Virgisporangium aurantiacum]